MTPDERLDRNLAALLRSAGPPATPERTAAARDVFLRRLAPRRPLRLTGAAASLLFAAAWAGVLLDSGAPQVGSPRGPSEVDRWIAELGHDQVEVRDAAAAKLDGLGLDVEYVLFELERRKGSPDLETARRAERLARRMRETAALGHVHEAAPFTLTGASASLTPVPADPAARHLELYDVTDLTDRAERLVEDIKTLRPDAWRDDAFIDHSVNLLRVRTTPDVHDLVRAYLSSARGGGLPAAPAARPHLDPLLEDPAKEGALLSLAADCLRARTRLVEAAHGPDPEASGRAKAVAALLDAPLKRATDHGTHRRTAIERLRATWSRHEAGLEDAIRSAFLPCEAADLRVLAPEDLSPTDRAALQAANGILVRPGKAKGPARVDLSLPDACVLFTLDSDARPARIVALRLMR
ncbi:MAG TPA: hypothetical protein VEJ18_01945 [Planctomycetota bacterium]|nr:hypothetical protein [Planctomycetota bacterium]